MSESFESRLTSASSRETFKKGKKLLKSGELLCCMESEPGVLRAVFRDPAGQVNRCELRGFPKGPFSGTCDCGSDSPGFCCHAMAAALHHAKYTVKYKETVMPPDTPAQYAGMKFAGLPVLLQDVLAPQTSFLEIDAKTEFPHVPSKWERVTFNVRLLCGKREYFGNINNLRQLHFGKSFAAALSLESFPIQDRQIIRFLALNGAPEGADISLDSELCAEFFHCLCGFRRFRRMGEPIVIHREPAVPLLLLEKLRSGFLLKSAIAVDGAPLPLKDVKVITGRAGCWIGMLGEYWWIPGEADVAWIRGFLRTTVQPCDAEAARILLESEDTLPVRIVPTSSIKVRRRKFKTLYDGEITKEGALDLRLSFDYDGHLCQADQIRLASDPGGRFWRRNTQEENERLQELVNFGFQQADGSRRRDGAAHLLLHDREAIGMFIDEMIPKWLREKRECLFSSSLAALIGNAASVALNCRVLASDAACFRIAFTLSAAGIPIPWKKLAEAVRCNQFFMPAGADGSPVKIPAPLRRLARAFGSVAVIQAPQDDLPDSDILEIPRSAAFLWASLGASFSEAVPVEFLRIKVDLDTLRTGLEKPVPLPDPALFRGELRPYQAAGVFWLKSMFERACNLILADEMGLGKTVQTLALLVTEQELTLPAMVICPTSLVENWRREAASFAPSLRIRTIEGANRGQLWKKVPDCDLCICSYALIKRDMKHAAPLSFRTLILDEAQHIKNPASANSRSCRQLRADHKLVLTGTPLENSAEDLWSIFDFLHPGFFGPLSAFRARYGGLSSDEVLKSELAEHIAPFIMRRRKKDVCMELPPKHEQILSCEMGSAQRALYDGFAAQAEERLRECRAGSLKGVELLAEIMRLRQICCDPDLLPEDLRPEKNAAGSAKTELLQELLEETIDSGHKTLVFSQFTTYLARIRSWLEAQNIRYEYLDGATKDRMERVDAFNSDPEIPVFLLSLKAGGVGLNLTSADTVIICDPWWNPAAEDQAADRTHRIGQTRRVNCIKLMVRDSIEERVLALQQRKKDLFNALVEEPGASLGAMTLDDFEFLLAPAASKS